MWLHFPPFSFVIVIEINRVSYSWDLLSLFLDLTPLFYMIFHISFLSNLVLHEPESLILFSSHPVNTAAFMKT